MSMPQALTILTGASRGLGAASAEQLVRGRAALLTTARRSELVEIAHVRLDKSGKTVRVILADCREVGR